MKFTAALAFIAGAAGAIAGAVGTPLVNRGAGRPSSNFNMKNTSYPAYSSNWAGAVQIASGFYHVTGTIVVPQVSGGYNSAASAWVGIDGDTCQSAILQTGVSFYGDGSFDAWWEWIPDYSYSYSNFAVSVGDTIVMTVDATSTTSGTASLENLSTGQRVSHTFTNPPSTLCETNAEWIVEDFMSGGSMVPFANFGSITFTNAYAYGNGGTYTPNGATIFDIEQNGRVLTNCYTSGNDLTCQYTG